MATETNNYKFQKPGEDDFYDIEVQNQNWDKTDTALKDLEDKKVSQNGGDITETNIKTLDSISEEFPLPAAGEKTKSFLSKVKKSMEDWKNFKNGIITLGMLSNQFENSTDKIPTSALVYALKQTTDQLNSNLGNLVAGSPAIQDCNNNFKQRGTTFVRWDRDTLNTPYKLGLSPAADGAIIDAGMSAYHTQVSIGYSAETLFIRRYAEGNGWNEWKRVVLNDDLLVTESIGINGNGTDRVTITLKNSAVDNSIVCINGDTRAVSDISVIGVYHSPSNPNTVEVQMSKPWSYPIRFNVVYKVK